jgi:lipoprotein NlpI
VIGRAVAIALACGLLIARGQAAQSPRALLDRASADFVAGRIAASVDGFDRVIREDPSAAPYLWQRGIALYYAGRYEDCRRQFEQHRTVNPDDVENAAWHFLCVARAESPEAARAALLPVGRDGRRPMVEVYRMFEGTLTEAHVTAAAGAEPSAQFFAHLYIGLYLEATGDARRSSERMRQAAAERFADAGGYMHDVARVHVALRR